MAKLYTADEVAQHNTEKDVWMTIHGGVYDLTDFLTKHPGGEDVLISLAGQDGTVCFDEIGHTEEAIMLRETLKIGEISGDSTSAASSPGAKKREPSVDDDDWVYEGGPKESGGSMVPVFISAGVALYALIFYFMY